ncbi:ELP2_1 [Sanghuangporus weigelae]
MSAAVSLDYISASANRYSRTAHASDSSLVAFGSGSFVALWYATEDDNNGIYQTLPGHDGLVTCVRFKSGENCFFSADDRGLVRCWRLDDEKWSTVSAWQAHTKSITALAVHEDYIITGSSDAIVIVWKRVSLPGEKKDRFEEIQRIDMKGRYPLDIQIASLPKSDSIVMAVSSTERNISIFARSEETFVRAASLPGHEDWVKSLAFQYDIASPSTLTLASGSQDGTIRLWNIEPVAKKLLSMDQQSNILTDDLLDSFEASLGDFGEGEEGGRQISMKRHVFATKSKDGSSLHYSITFDALLIGHEAGITSLSWRPSYLSGPMLLSTSTDSSIILWAPTSAGRDLADSSEGSGHEMELTCLPGGGQEDGDAGDLNYKMLIHRIGLGISWSPGGEYLISTGPDQTTRIHGNVLASSTGGAELWHEICRPQVHGYDLIDAVFLTSTRFVSIADEKVARVFDAPRSFVSLCKHLGILPDIDDEAERPAAASVPPLGLSNKAVDGDDSAETPFPLPTTSTVQRRPFEGELAVSTLWPEVEKLFGHGYELHAIAASHSGEFVATSCKATTPEHAGIKIYETKNWQLYGQTLFGHQLTITRIAFSPDDRYILSVSRDRSWCLYERNDDGYVAVKADKSHARIIWDCAWAHENDIFVTASRDKTVKIWHVHDLSSKKQTPRHTIKLKEAATAVALTEASPDGRRLLAIGTENGEISIYDGLKETPEKWTQQVCLGKSIAHLGQIHRMSWRPRRQDGEIVSGYQLATCSEDGTLRIIRIRV